MEQRHKILLLDDDPDLLAVYQEILARLPSGPEIYTATSGPRAMKLLEAESFRVLICDLKMPKMDGLQVLSVVRRKYPQLRTVVLTSVVDERFRSRVYALGVDLFWQKPSTEDEVKMFLECLESLLGRENGGGFRGLQSKSLMDIIQLECLAQSSAVLRITNGPLSGTLWILNGEVIDAQADQLAGEAAFRKILSWKTGNFELLAANVSRPRTIFKSYNALLLETAQALDESAGAAGEEPAKHAARTLLSLMDQFKGIEFVLIAKPGNAGSPEACGLENPKPMSAWAQRTADRFRTLADRFHAGQLEQIEGLGPQRNVAITPHGEAAFCVGWHHSVPAEEVHETTRKVLAQWVS